MASTKTFADMHANATDAPAPEDFIVTVMKNQRLEILEKRDKFVRVRLLMAGAKEGWLPASAISDADPPDAPIKMDEFFEECAHQEQVFGVAGHYIAAIAKLRSNITNRIAAQGEFGGIGLFQLTAAEWAADWGSEAEFGFEFLPAEISDWRNQCTLFALMARRALIACEGALGQRPSSVDLLLAQTIGAKATANLKATPASSVETILAAVADGDLPPGGLARDRLLSRYASLLKEGAAAATGTQVLAKVEAALVRGFAETVGLIPANLIKPVDDPKKPAASPIAGAGLNLDAPDIRPERKPIAQQIVQAFADKGFNVVQQAAALANAIAESGLNPHAQNVSSIEASFGLFQLNTRGGLGTGHNPADLVRAEVNIGIILNEALKVPSFRAATTLGDAVSAFVTKIERPGDQIGAIKNRTAIGQRLLLLVPSTGTNVPGGR